MTCASRSSQRILWSRALGFERRLTKHLRVRELLIQLQRELEARRRALDPAARDVGPRLTVERRVHLDGVEVFGVEAQLVEPLGPGALGAGRRVEEAVPLALARSGSSSPTCRCASPRRYNNQLSGHELKPDSSRQGNAHYQRDLPFGAGRVHLRRAAVRVRAPDRVRPALLAGAIRHTPSTRAASVRLDDVIGEVDRYRLPAGRGDRRRAAAAGGCVSADAALLDSGKTVLLETGGHRSTARVPADGRDDPRREVPGQRRGREATTGTNLERCARTTRSSSSSRIAPTTSSRATSSHGTTLAGARRGDPFVAGARRPRPEDAVGVGARRPPAGRACSCSCTSTSGPDTRGV